MRLSQGYCDKVKQTNDESQKRCWQVAASVALPVVLLGTLTLRSAITLPPEQSFQNPFVTSGAEQSSSLAPPCTPHPTEGLLHRTFRWSDRPHFATRRHYDTRLFETLPPHARVT